MSSTAPCALWHISTNDGLDSTLTDREKTHGDYRVQSDCFEDITTAIRSGRNWDRLPAYAKFSLQMAAAKFARILSGDWTHVDHWHDIAGYAQLVEKELTKK
jgi:hypothetical protein